MSPKARLRIAVVVTGHRPDDFADCVAAARSQCDKVVAVATTEAALAYTKPLTDVVVDQVGTPLNISAWWDRGFEAAETIAAGRPYDVAQLNDDAIIDSDWFDRLAAAMHAAGAAGASGSRQASKLASCAGYAFLIDGTKGIRADERARWWYSEDPIHHRCFEAGGFVIVNGVAAANRRADSEVRRNPEAARISREDKPVIQEAYGEFVGPWNVHRGKGRTPLVISAPSGAIPTHLLQAAGNRPILVLTTSEWEDRHLAYAADTFDWFVFVKESTRILDAEAFWAKVDTATEPAWLFAWPSCYMGLFARSPLQAVLRRIKVTDKWGSVREEAALARRLGMRKALWPEINDANALRVEMVDGEPELVIGNAILEKSKGSAWCGRCSYDPPGVCDDLLDRFKVPA